jgi:thiol-disulfide isomerase/thioredoxin
MRRWIVCAAVLFGAANLADAQAPNSQVRLDLVSYKQLGNEIKNLHGKVVLVDFWGDFCRPCKEKFPHVMALQRKYAKAGLAVVTVAVDDVADPTACDRVKFFLQQQGAVSRNLLLAEKSEVWVPKLKMNSVPSMFLFDQEGRLINRWTSGDVDLYTIEKRIAELLAHPEE